MLTIRRVRTYTTLIAVTIWTVLAIDLSAPGPLDRLGKVKGTDFVQFFAIGSLAHERNWTALYDANALNSRTHAIAPESNETVYLPIQSPQTALLAAPLARLPYGYAVAIWFALIVLTYAACCRSMWNDCAALHAHPVETLTACAAFGGLFSVVVNGQISFLALGCVVLAVRALRRERSFAAGLALGLLVFKPHWALAAAAVFLAAYEWRVVAGLVGGAAAETVVTSFFVPASVTRAYILALRAAPSLTALLEPQPGDSLKGFATVLVPHHPSALAAYGLAACAAAFLAARVWRSTAAFEIRASAVVLATILISPHANAYDLVLLAPVLFLLANWMVCMDRNRPAVLPWLLCALYVGPMVGGLAPIVRQQFTVTAMAAVLVVCARLAASGGERISSGRADTRPVLARA